MTNPDKEIEERLRAMFQRKLRKMWTEHLPRISPEGMYHTEDRIKHAQRWIDYVEGLGGRILDWKMAIRGRLGNGVLLHNPCEHPEDFGKDGADPRYIFLPEETVLKILALGWLP